MAVTDLYNQKLTELLPTIQPIGNITGAPSTQQQQLLDQIRQNSVTSFYNDLYKDYDKTAGAKMSELVNKGILTGDLGAQGLANVDKEYARLYEQGVLGIENTNLQALYDTINQNKQMELDWYQSLLGAGTQAQSLEEQAKWMQAQIDATKEANLYNAIGSGVGGIGSLILQYLTSQQQNAATQKLIDAITGKTSATGTGAIGTATGAVGSTATGAAGITGGTAAGGTIFGGGTATGTGAAGLGTFGGAGSEMEALDLAAGAGLTSGTSAGVGAAAGVTGAELLGALPYLGAGLGVFGIMDYLAQQGTRGYNPITTYQQLLSGQTPIGPDGNPVDATPEQIASGYRAYITNIQMKKAGYPIGEDKGNGETYTYQDFDIPKEVQDAVNQYMQDPFNEHSVIGTNIYQGLTGQTGPVMDPYGNEIGAGG